MTLLADQIRLRAFELYQEHSGLSRSSEDNWYQAEQDIMLVPEAHLITNDAFFNLQIAVPGLHEKNLKVTALADFLIVRVQFTVPGFLKKNLKVTVLPDALIVSGETEYKHTYTHGARCVCEIGKKTLFQRFDLPARIDAVNVHIHIEHGVLTVIATRLVADDNNFPL